MVLVDAYKLLLSKPNPAKTLSRPRPISAQSARRYFRYRIYLISFLHSKYDNTYQLPQLQSQAD